MAAPRPVSVDFTAGSRRFFGVRRMLRDVSFTLPQLLDGTGTPLPAIGPQCDGYRILSAPCGWASGHFERSDFICGAMQRFRRHYIDMASGFDGYMDGFSSKTRSTLRRKRRKLDSDAGAPVTIREYRTPGEIERFLDLALPLSGRTYQARLLDAGLPQDAGFRAEAMELAMADRLRAYLLFVGEQPVSYLFLPVQGQVVIYAHLGFDPEFASLSPGTGLQMEALERLFAEQRYSHFDFTEGEGSHKAMFGTASVSGCSFLMLRPTLANRMLLGSRGAFDRSVARVRVLARESGTLPAVRRLLRA